MRKLLKWYYGKASIRKKLVISYLVLVLIPLAVLGWYSYQSGIKNLIRQTRDVISSNAATISYTLQVNLEREDDNLKYFSYNSDFREKLASGRTNPSALAQELNRSVEPVFWYFITSDRNMKGIQVYSPCISQDIGSFLKTEENCQEKEWYKYHQTNFKTLWTCEDGRIYATRPLLDAETSSETIGVMKLEVFPERFVEALYRTEFLDNGVVLIDEKGQVIASRAVADEELDGEILQKILGSAANDPEGAEDADIGADLEGAKSADAADDPEGEKNQDSVDDSEGTGGMDDPGIYEEDNYILTAGEKLDTGWQVFYYIDKQQIAGDMNQIFYRTMMIVGICLVLITFLISFISRLLSRRILKLKQCAETVGQGKFDITVEHGYTDEIGIVANSFSVMSNKINEMISEVYQMGLEKRATELKALQAMINPHFLYNCLSSIKWKAIRSEQEDIAAITGHLAKFYRTSLNEGKQITKVERELENIRSYLELQSRMHDGSFDVEYGIPEQGLDYEMPNFLLQPIVENAIRHGIDCCEAEKGLIRVVYEPGETELYFRVYNNGPQLEEEQLKKMFGEPGKGYGIYNIQERIRMYYDGGCGVSASVTEDGLICFTVKIRKSIENRFGIEA